MTRIFSSILILAHFLGIAMPKAYAQNSEECRTGFARLWSKPVPTESPADELRRIKKTEVKTYFTKTKKIIERNGEVSMETPLLDADPEGTKKFREAFDRFLDLSEEYGTTRSWEIRKWLKGPRGNKDPYPELYSAFVEKGITMDQLLTDIKEKMLTAKGSSTLTKREKILSQFEMEKMKEHAAHLTGKMLGQAKTFGLYVGGTLIVTGQTTAIKPAVDYVREQAEYVRDTLGMQAQKILGNKEEYISWLTSLKNANKKLDLHNFSDPKDDIDAQTALNEFETEVGKTLPKFRPTLLKINPNRDAEDIAQLADLRNGMQTGLKDYLSIFPQYQALQAKAKSGGLEKLSPYDLLQLKNYRKMLEQYETQIATALAAWKVHRLSLDEETKKQKEKWELDDGIFSDIYGSYMSIMNKDTYRKALTKQLGYRIEALESYLK